MIKKIPVPCPHCGARVRMPTKVRPGKKPKCPSCKTIIYPHDVFPQEALRVDSIPYVPSQTQHEAAELPPENPTPPVLAPETTAPGNPTQPFFADDTPAAAEAQTAQESPEQAAAKLAALSRRGKLPVIPGYRILALLGQGGMGVVYHVQQIGLKREAALKMILGGQYSDSNSRSRFQVEAEAIAKLRHPNVVQVYGYGEHEGLPYLTLEYVDGGTVGHLLRKRKTLPQEEAVQLLLGIADGVAHAHTNGIVHRDLKPVNILLNQDGTPKVADFGLARIANQDITSTGALLGTPSYMAPEQATGRIHDIGPASDVYSLGAILYEMLTGRPPFQGDTPFEILQRVITEEPASLRGIVPGTERDLETICLKCLAKEANRRYADAHELAADLRRWQAGEPILGRRASRVSLAWKKLKKNKATTFAAAVVVSAVAVVVSVLLTPQKPPVGIVKDAPPPPPVDEKKLFDAALDRGFQLLNEGDAAGSLLWFARGDGYSKNIDSARLVANKVRINSLLGRVTPLAHRFSHTGKITLMQFSPDGRSLLTAAENESVVHLWDLATGKERWKIDLPSEKAHATVSAFSRDGQKVAVVTKDRNASVYEVATGKRIAGPWYHTMSVNVAAFSPDGTKLATGGGAILYTYFVTTYKTEAKMEPYTYTVMEMVTREVEVTTGGKPEKKLVTDQVPVTKTGVRQVNVAVPVTEARTRIRGEKDELDKTAGGGFVDVWDVAANRPASPRITVGDIVNRLAFAPHGRTLALGLDTYQTATPATMPAPAPTAPAPAPPAEKPKDEKKSTTAQLDLPRSEVDGRYFIAAPQQAREPEPTLQPVGPADPTKSVGNNSPVQFWDISGLSPQLLRVLPEANRPQQPLPSVDPNEKPKPIPGRVAHLSYNTAGHVRAVIDSTAYEIDPRTGGLSFQPVFLGYYVKSAHVDFDCTSGLFSALLTRHDRVDSIFVNPTAPAPAVMPAAPVAPAAMPAPPKAEAIKPEPFREPPPPVGQLTQNRFPLKGDLEIVDAIRHGGQFLTAASDKTLRLWDVNLADSQTESEPILLSAAISSIASDVSGRYFAAATDDFQVSVWDVTGGTFDANDVIVRDETRNRQISLSDDGRFAYTSRSDSTLQVWDLSNGKSVLDGGPRENVEFATLVNMTLAAVRNGRVELYDLGRSNPKNRIETKDFGYGNCCLHLTADAKKLFLHQNQYSDKYKCLIADVSPSALEPVTWTESVQPSAVTFSADGNTVYFSSYDGKIRCRDTATGKPTIPDINTGHTGPFTMSRLLEGNRIITAGQLHVKVWDLTTGQQVGTTLTGGINNPSHLELSPDRTLLVLAGTEPPAQPRDFPKARYELRDWPAFTLRGTVTDSASALQPQFSPDGKFLLTRSDRFRGSKITRLWEITPTKLQPLEPFTLSYESDARFGPKGELFSVGYDSQFQVVRKHEFANPEKLDGDLIPHSQLLALREIDSTGAVVPLSNEALVEHLTKWRAARQSPTPEAVQSAFEGLLRNLKSGVQNGQWPYADSLSQWLLAEQPNNAELAALVGDIRAAHQDWKGAAEAYEKVIIAKIDVPRTRIKLAIVKLAANEDKAAVAALDPILDDPSCGPLALALKSLTNLQDATSVRVWKKSVEAMPTVKGTPPDDLYHSIYGLAQPRLALALISLRLDEPDAATALEAAYDVSPMELLLVSLAYRKKNDDSKATQAESRMQRMLLTPPPGIAARWGWEQRVLIRILRDRIRVEMPKAVMPKI